MPRFYFDFYDGDRQPTDREGIDLADAETAKNEANRALTQLMFEECGKRHTRSITCHVRNASGNVIYRSALTLEGKWTDFGA